MSLKTKFLTCFCFGLCSCRWKFTYIFNLFYAVRSESYRIRWNNAGQGPLRRSRSFKVTYFGTDRKLMYDFLLVINTNLPHILHRFQDVAFDRSKIAIWLSLLCLTPQAEGFNWDDLRKKFLWVSMAGQGTKCRRKKCRKLQPCE